VGLWNPRPLQGEADRVHDGIDAVCNFVVGEAQDVPASRLEPGAADPVPFGDLVGVVRRAVDLDDEPAWPAGEVRDVGTDGLLATEAEARGVSAEEPPDASLGVGGLAAHAPGVAQQPGVASWHDTEVSDAIARFKGVAIPVVLLGLLSSPLGSGGTGERSDPTGVAVGDCTVTLPESLAFGSFFDPPRTHVNDVPSPHTCQQGG